LRLLDAGGASARVEVMASPDTPNDETIIALTSPRLVLAALVILAAIVLGRRLRNKA
jgi:hypothetical protein